MLRSFDHLTPSRSPLRDSMLRSPKLDALAAAATFTRCNSPPPGGSPLGLSSPHGNGGGGMAPLAAVSPSSASRPMMERVEHLQSCMESMRAVLAEANKQLDAAQPDLHEDDGAARAQVQWERGRGFGGGEGSALHGLQAAPHRPSHEPVSNECTPHLLDNAPLTYACCPGPIQRRLCASLMSAETS